MNIFVKILGTNNQVPQIICCCLRDMVDIDNAGRRVSGCRMGMGLDIFWILDISIIVFVLEM